MWFVTVKLTISRWIYKQFSGWNGAQIYIFIIKNPLWSVHLLSQAKHTRVLSESDQDPRFQVPSVQLLGFTQRIDCKPHCLGKHTRVSFNQTKWLGVKEPAKFASQNRIQLFGWAPNVWNLTAIEVIASSSHDESIRWRKLWAEIFFDMHTVQKDQQHTSMLKRSDNWMSCLSFPEFKAPVSHFSLCKCMCTTELYTHMLSVNISVESLLLQPPLCHEDFQWEEQILEIWLQGFAPVQPWEH